MVSPGFAELHASRFLVPLVTPACVLVAYALVGVERLAGKILPSPVAAVPAAVLAVVAIAHAAGVLGPAVRPYWDPPGAAHWEREELAPSLEQHERLAQRVAELGPGPDTEIVYLGTHEGGVAAESDNLDVIVPLLRLRDRRDHDPPLSSAAPSLISVHGRACTATPEPGLWQEQLALRAFADCASFRRWHSERSVACAVRGRPLYHRVRSLSADTAVSCVDPAAGSRRLYRLTGDPELHAVLTGPPGAERVLATWELTRRGDGLPSELFELLVGRVSAPGDSAERIAALWTVQRKGAPGEDTLDAIEGALDAEDPKLREAALYALSAFLEERRDGVGATSLPRDRLERARARLAQAWLEGDAWSSLQRSLRTVAPKELAEGLCTVQGEGGSEVPPSVWFDLLQVLGGRDAHLRQLAASVLQESAEFETGDCRQAAGAALRASDGSQIRLALERALGAREAATRRAGAWVVMALGPAAHPVTEALRPLLDDADPEVRQAGVMAVGASGGLEPMRAPVLRLLGDGDGNVRAAALEVLLEGPWDRELEAAVRALGEDPEEEIRDEARRALVDSATR